ncbi:nicotinamide N-methyltransferase [Phlyctema vagabunda]|uniref:Nicotinamide N-methyltransferase n=1 Tax=Phlyctema vagabunda TaxID=108571 RepID=A0ABR4PZ02_9HELO
MLTDKIRVVGSESATEPEDILESALAVIFPDDICNQHGDEGNSVIYLSPIFGSITLSLCDPSFESRGLFSHFLWNASLQLAEFIEEDAAWDVKNERVLELGAGTGLAGMISGLKGAEQVVISDYPAPEVLENIRGNVTRNIEPRKVGTDERVAQEIREVTVEGHEWGVLDDTFSVQEKESFGRILVADCLWMPWQHENLLKSIRWFLKPEGRAWVIAGFHTGREKMAGFYEEERIKRLDLEIEKIWERDAEGRTRDWVTDRGREDITERKRWLVIAILKRKKTT